MKRPVYLICCLLLIILIFTTTSTPKSAKVPVKVPGKSPTITPFKNLPNQEILTLNPEVERKALNGTYLLYGPEMPVSDWYQGRVACVSKNPIRFVTAAHCVLVRKKIKTEHGVKYKTINSPLGKIWYITHPVWKDKFLTLKLLAYDMYLDVAVLGLAQEPTSLELIEMTLNENIREDQMLFMFGNSHDGGTDYQMLWGKHIFIISKTDEEVIPPVEQKREWYFTYMISRPGCSGAPVFNINGEMVGLNWGRYLLNDRFYCSVTPAQYIKSVLESTKDDSPTPLEIRNKPPDLDGYDLDDSEVTNRGQTVYPDRK